MNLDGNAVSHRALRSLRQENPEWRSVVVRSRRYLNNIVEQDHRAIKRRCAPMLALKSFLGCSDAWNATGPSRLQRARLSGPLVLARSGRAYPCRCLGATTFAARDNYCAYA